MTPARLLGELPGVPEAATLAPSKRGTQSHIHRLSSAPWERRDLQHAREHIAPQPREGTVAPTELGVCRV